MFKTRRLIPLLLLAGLAGACTAPVDRVRAGLADAGIPQPIARCMAPRMVDRLSAFQLRRLGEIGKARHAGDVGELLHRLRALNDARIVDVTATSAALCATGLG